MGDDKIEGRFTWSSPTVPKCWPQRSPSAFKQENQKPRQKEAGWADPTAWVGCELQGRGHTESQGESRPRPRARKNRRACSDSGAGADPETGPGHSISASPRVRKGVLCARPPACPSSSALRGGCGREAQPVSGACAPHLRAVASGPRARALRYMQSPVKM